MVVVDGELAASKEEEGKLAAKVVYVTFSDCPLVRKGADDDRQGCMQRQCMQRWFSTKDVGWHKGLGQRGGS